ncbi:YheC/YheD family protein [Serpentinicella alkaliphila]|uniref:YheC/D-like protein n=1 Tax=Serpentinicella alkaliphila TaxID=1734049 RepID=A0A4R2SWX9_9FIRM|nr:YheC/YheD family protein [Serpentinicella alkaliphila]QUH27047.1 YheC/YheD family protein [Serpentinicella alkaliphila]TCP93401.1 YheC/D-like protein [Serpentinicella alkaliphila]
MSKTKIKNPIIGILISPKESRKEYIQAYTPFINNQKFTLIVFNSKNIDWEKNNINGITFINGEQVEITLPFPRVVYNRLSTTNSNLMKRFEKYIGLNKCFNYISKFSKWKVYNTLKDKGFEEYLPKTYLLKEINIIDILMKYTSIYLKPSYGQLGENVYKLSMTSDRLINLYYHSTRAKETFKNNNELNRMLTELVGKKEFIVQQEIPMVSLNKGYFDIRVLIQKNINGNWEVTSIVSRVTNKFFNNTSLYEKVVLTEDILDEFNSIDKVKTILKLKKLSIQVAKTLESSFGHIGELSVDYGISSTGDLKIIEINGQPQKKIYKFLKNKKQHDNAYIRPIEYAYYLSRK